MREIALSNGMIALVDDLDFEELSKFRWHYHRSLSGTGYAYRHNWRGKPPTILMHRHILKAVKGQVTDHIDRNGLNNQRENIRLCSQSQNLANSVARKASKRMLTSKGVHFDRWTRSSKKWFAQITVAGVHRFIGRFSNQKSAEDAYDMELKAAHPNFALTNDQIRTQLCPQLPQCY